MQLISQVVPAQDDGEGSNGDILANKLRRFGDPAKQELLKRAVGNHPGWRNVAGAILREWRSWSPSDVPQLAEALRKQPGGWVAIPLGEIATPEAIRALVADLPNGSASQTGFALKELGAKAIPYMFPLLEGDKSARAAADVIREMDGAITPLMPSWIAKAVGQNQRIGARIAALRAVAALGSCTSDLCRPLHALLQDPSSKIREETETTLRAVRDPIVAADVAQRCHPSADRFDSLASDSLRCLSELAEYGDGAHDVGLNILPFLASENGAERSYAITALGQIGFQPAVPQIEESLQDADWRVVYAAIRTLGRLGDVTAVPSLERIASEYWLPEIRTEAQVVAQRLSSDVHLERPSGLSTLNESGGEPFVIDRDILRPIRPCKSATWKWEESRFSTPMIEEERNIELRLPDGKFVGANHGEWGGELTWKPASGEPVSLRKDNVVAIAPVENGAIVAFGLAHLSVSRGYALHVTRSVSGPWQLSEAARLPGEPEWMTTIGPDLFAVSSEGRVIVLSTRRGILGLASCE